MPQPLLKAPLLYGDSLPALTDPTASKAFDRSPLTAETLAASIAAQDVEEEERVGEADGMHRHSLGIPLRMHAWAFLDGKHAAMQNLDNYIPFRLAYLADSMVKDYPEVRRGGPCQSCHAAGMQPVARPRPLMRCMGHFADFSNE